MSVRRVLQIIEFVASRNAPIGVSDACEYLNLPRATVYRLFTTLESQGVLQRICNSNKVELADRFLRTIITGAGNDQLVSGFRDHMINIADSARATAFLGRLSGKLVELVHTATPTDRAVAYIHPGLNIRPAHACSASRAILAYLDEDQIEEIVGSNNTAFTDKTLTDKDAVLEELRATRKRGYAVCEGEIDVGVTSIAVPAILGRAGVVCSVGIVAASSHLREMGLPAAAELLKDRVTSAIAGFGNNIKTDSIGGEAAG